MSFLNGYVMASVFHDNGYSNSLSTTYGIRSGLNGGQIRAIHNPPGMVLMGGSARRSQAESKEPYERREFRQLRRWWRGAHLVIPQAIPEPSAHGSGYIQVVYKWDIRTYFACGSQSTFVQRFELVAVIDDR